jgi:hypothetical protein
LYYYHQLGRYANILEREPWRDVAHNVDMNALYGDLAVCNGYMAAFNFNYYSRNPALKKQEFPKHSRNVTHENMGELEQTIGDFRRIWVIYCHRGKNWEWINKKISESHSLLYSKRYRSIELSLFEKKH